jgi:GAF domain-containing protein
VVSGVLVLYAEESELFEPEYVSVLQDVGDTVGVALANARRYRHALDSAALSERIVRQYVQESWNQLVEARPRATAYRYRSRQAAREAADAWLPGMVDAVREGQMVVSDSGPRGVGLAVPLVQNGVVIGVLGLSRPPGTEWDEDERMLIRTVGDQMTQALENRRLFEAARSRARQEMLLRRTAERIRLQPDLDAALRVAAEEMRRLVGASEVAIRLGAGPAQDEERS